jgi:uncharacterized protein (DUF433 family)
MTSYLKTTPSTPTAHPGICIRRTGESEYGDRTPHVYISFSLSSSTPGITINLEIQPETGATHEHHSIVRTLRGGREEPIIRGTAIRVRTLVEYSRLGISPEELLQHFPHLSLRRISDALNYYEDHREEIDRLINQNRPATTVDNASTNDPL